MHSVVRNHTMDYMVSHTHTEGGGGGGGEGGGGDQHTHTLTHVRYYTCVVQCIFLCECEGVTMRIMICIETAFHWLVVEYYTLF